MSSGSGSASGVIAPPDPVTPVAGPASTIIAHGGRATGLVNPPSDPGSSLLSAAQLASMRATVAATLPWFAEVLADTQTQNSDDDQADSWNAIVVYPCDIEFIGAVEETSTGAQIQAVGGYLITLPWGARVVPENRLRINGVVYEVRNRADNWTDQTALYVTAEEVR
jgi:hypothetical protein